MRRQTAVGEALPAGSSRALRLDPHSLPVQFDARDARADGGIRHIEISRDRIVVRRAISGIPMVLRLRVAEYLGIALRDDAGGRTSISLEHKDPSLSVPLMESDRVEDLASTWQAWACELALPRLVSDDSEFARPVQTRDAGPAPRRRRRNAIRRRRPSFLTRRKPGALRGTVLVYAGEREIVART